jgi:hypothetical protein
VPDALAIPTPGESTLRSTPVEPNWLDTAWAWATDSSNTMNVVAVLMAALLALSLFRRRKRTTTGGSNSAEDITTTDRAITRITALIATAVVAQGMWVFFAEVIRIHWTFRTVLFSFIEMQMIAAYRRTRRYLYRHGSLGNGPFTILGLAAATATLAAVHVNTIDERLLRLFAAAVAAHMLLEELREERDILRFRNAAKWPPLRKWTDAVRDILVRIGISEPNSITVTEVATQRRIDRLSRLLNHFHAVSADQKPGKLKKLYLAWLTRRVVRKTQAACKYINLAEDPAVRAMLLRRLSVVRGIVAATRPADGQGRTAWAVEVATTGDALVGEVVTPTGDAPAVGDADAHPAVTATVTEPSAVTPARQPSPRPAVTVAADATPAKRHTVTTPIVYKRVTVTPAATSDAVTADADGTTDASVTNTPSPTPTTDATVTEVGPLSRDLIDARFRNWTVGQVRSYATDKARKVLADGGTKADGMREFLLTCMALGVDPAGKWMAEAVVGAESAGRTRKAKWLAELAVADAEQILRDAHDRIVTEIAAGGDGRD